jgi:hypothetical protein
MKLRQNLQKMIDDTPDREILVLAAGEYEGPVTINRNIKIEGVKSTIWSRKGPVMHIKAHEVELHGLRIEVTRFDEEMDNKPEHVALMADPAVNVILDDVVVRGYVVGIHGENGAWLVPPSIDLGIFAPRVTNTFNLTLYVPVTCQISTVITGVTISPSTLMPGKNDVVFTVKDIYPDTLLLGRCFIRSMHVKRPIDITGRAANDNKLQPVNHRLLWEPSIVPTQPTGNEQSDFNSPGEHIINELWLANEINRLISTRRYDQTRGL